MRYLQCCKKVAGKPSLATAGSRATLHSFFLNPEKSTKPALALQTVTKKLDLEEEGTGEAITIASPEDKREGDEQSNPEDT